MQARVVSVGSVIVDLPGASLAHPDFEFSGIVRCYQRAVLPAVDGGGDVCRARRPGWRRSRRRAGCGDVMDDRKPVAAGEEGAGGDGEEQQEADEFSRPAARGPVGRRRRPGLAPGRTRCCYRRGRRAPRRIPAEPGAADSSVGGAGGGGGGGRRVVRGFGGSRGGVSVPGVKKREGSPKPVSPRSGRGASASGCLPVVAGGEE